MSVTIGMPSLKLNNVGRVGKHSGSFKTILEICSPLCYNYKKTTGGI